MEVPSPIERSASWSFRLEHRGQMTMAKGQSHTAAGEKLTVPVSKRVPKKISLSTSKVSRKGNASHVVKNKRISDFFKPIVKSGTCEQKAVGGPEEPSSDDQPTSPIITKSGLASSTAKTSETQTKTSWIQTKIKMVSLTSCVRRQTLSDEDPETYASTVDLFLGSEFEMSSRSLPSSPSQTNRKKVRKGFVGGPCRRELADITTRKENLGSMSVETAEALTKNLEALSFSETAQGKKRVWRRVNRKSGRRQKGSSRKKTDPVSKPLSNAAGDSASDSDSVFWEAEEQQPIERPTTLTVSVLPPVSEEVKKVKECEPGSKAALTASKGFRQRASSYSSPRPNFAVRSRSRSFSSAWNPTVVFQGMKEAAASNGDRAKRNRRPVSKFHVFHLPRFPRSVPKTTENKVETKPEAQNRKRSRSPKKSRSLSPWKTGNRSIGGCLTAKDGEIFVNFLATHTREIADLPLKKQQRNKAMLENAEKRLTEINAAVRRSLVSLEETDEQLPELCLPPTSPVSVERPEFVSPPPLLSPSLVAEDLPCAAEPVTPKKPDTDHHNNQQLPERSEVLFKSSGDVEVSTLKKQADDVETNCDKEALWVIDVSSANGFRLKKRKFSQSPEDGEDVALKRIKEQEEIIPNFDGTFDVESVVNHPVVVLDSDEESDVAEIIDVDEDDNDVDEDDDDVILSSEDDSDVEFVGSEQQLSSTSPSTPRKEKLVTGSPKGRKEKSSNFLSRRKVILSPEGGSAGQEECQSVMLQKKVRLVLQRDPQEPNWTVAFFQALPETQDQDSVQLSVPLLGSCELRVLKGAVCLGGACLTPETSRRFGFLAFNGGMKTPYYRLSLEMKKSCKEDADLVKHLEEELVQKSVAVVHFRCHELKSLNHLQHHRLHLNLAALRKNPVQVADSCYILPGVDAPQDDRRMVEHEWFREPLAKGSRFLICGPAGCGKSTALRYLTNSLLTRHGHERVGWLDADPGQVEFSVPGCLSFVSISRPILGLPAFHTALGPPGKCPSPGLKISTHFIGSVNISQCKNEYMQYMRILADEMEGFRDPILVNTMGWIRDLGADLMKEVFALIRPTHLMGMYVPNKRHWSTPESSKGSSSSGGKMGEREGQETESDTRNSLELILQNSTEVLRETKIYWQSSSTKKVDRVQNRVYQILGHLSLTPSENAAKPFSFPLASIHFACPAFLRPPPHLVSLLRHSVVGLGKWRLKVSEMEPKKTFDHADSEVPGLTASFLCKIPNPNTMVFLGLGVVTDVVVDLDPKKSVIRLVTGAKPPFDVILLSPDIQIAASPFRHDVPDPSAASKNTCASTTSMSKASLGQKAKSRSR